MPLPVEFYERDALDVARDLIGCHIARAGVCVRITEVEAYRFPNDTANHARFGRTRRNAPMWGPPGHAYVYLCYGLHQMLNFVTGPEGHAAAALIRAAEVVDGIALVQARRGGRTDPLTGPGKVGAALSLTSALSGSALFRSALSGSALSGSALTGPIEVSSRDRPVRLRAGPRVGIGYASPSDQAAPWRFADADSPCVSAPRGLVLLEG